MNSESKPYDAPEVHDFTAADVFELLRRLRREERERCARVAEECLGRMRPEKIPAVLRALEDEE